MTSFLESHYLLYMMDVMHGHDPKDARGQHTMYVVFNDIDDTAVAEELWQAWEAHLLAGKVAKRLKP